ncbi:chromate transporter [bacterium]|nr:chromate transporter [bacterium]
MIYFELFYVFFLVGLFTFGGGYAMISILETEILSRSWLDSATFYNIVSISESTPGPIAINMATFVGRMQGGVLGSVLATIGVTLPSFIIILLIVSIFSKLLDNKIFNAILYGIKAVVVGLIIATACSFLFNSLVNDISTFNFDFVALVIFLSIILLSVLYKRKTKKAISPYLILIISGVLGIILYLIDSGFVL